MTGSAIILANLAALTTPLLAIDAAGLRDEIVTGGRKPSTAIIAGVTLTINSPPVPLMRVTRGLVSEAEPRPDTQIAIELDRAVRAVKAAAVPVNLRR